MEVFRLKKELSTLFNTRQYMESEEFEVFYYNDVNLDHISSHSHNYYEIYFFLEGDADYEIEGIRYSLQYGDYMLIPPGRKHRPVFHSSQSPYRRLVLWLSQPFYDQLAGNTSDFSYSFDYVKDQDKYHFRTDYITFQQIQGRMLELIEEQGSNRPFRETSCRLMVCSLLVALNKITYDRVNPSSPSYENALYLNVCDYINNHLNEELSLDKLAAFFFVSKYHISHIFKDNMGISVHQYILKKRLQAGKNMILSGESFSKVVNQYGFNDYTSFYRAFRKEFGLSPKEYREQHRLVEPF